MESRERSLRALRATGLRPRLARGGARRRGPGAPRARLPGVVVHVARPAPGARRRRDGARWPRTSPASATPPPARPAPGSATPRAWRSSATQLEIDTCVLVVHDWGGLIGLRWACDNAGAATALGDQLERLLPRRPLARPGRDDAHGGRGRAVDGGPDARRVRGAAGALERGHRRAGGGRVLEGVRGRAPPREPSSSSTAPGTSRSSRPTRARWPTSTCRCCSCGGTATSSLPVAGAHRLARELPRRGAGGDRGRRALRAGGRARPHRRRGAGLPGAAVARGPGTARSCARVASVATPAGPQEPATPPSRRSPAETAGGDPGGRSRCQNRGVERLFDLEDSPRGGPGCPRPSSRWPPGCGRAPWASSWARSTCSAAAPRCAPRSRRASRTR